MKTDTSCMDFDRFVHHFEYEPIKEFERDGASASWAPNTNGGPKTWVHEDSRIALPPVDPQKEFTLGSLAALSFDQRLIAVASNAVVKVYDVASLMGTATVVVNAESVASLSVNAWCGASVVSRESGSGSSDPTYTVLLQSCVSLSPVAWT